MTILRDDGLSQEKQITPLRGFAVSVEMMIRWGIR
jgi:hypothetical protein